MNKRLNFFWRLLATGFCFATFSIGGLFLTLFILQPMLLMRDREQRARRTRWWIHKSFGAFMGLMECLGIMRLTVEGREHLQNHNNALILANHPTLVDVVALVSLMPNVSCVVKEALWRSPFLGGVVRAANYISNSNPETLLQDCANDIAGGKPLLIFPEGTRTRSGEALNFLRGASYIALACQRPILPILIYCTPPTLSKQTRWYQIPQQKFHLRVKILPPESVSRWVEGVEVPTLAARRLTLALETFFTQQLERYE